MVPFAVLMVVTLKNLYLTANPKPQTVYTQPVLERNHELFFHKVETLDSVSDGLAWFLPFVCWNQSSSFFSSSWVCEAFPCCRSGQMIDAWLGLHFKCIDGPGLGQSVYLGSSTALTVAHLHPCGLIYSHPHKL